MTGYVGTASGRKQIQSVWVGTASGRKQIQTAWVGTASGKKVWYQAIAAVNLTASAAAYNQINLSWTSAGTGATYVLKRGSTTIYSGTGLSKNDTGLTASKAYSYTLTATMGSATVSDTASATTPARPTTQKTVVLTMNAGSSYQGDGDRRTDPDGLAHLYTGYYSSNHGQQKSLWTFAIPADLRNCKSVDRVRVSIWCEHAYSGTSQSFLVTHHGNATAAKFPGSTGLVAGPTHHPKPGWWADQEWVDITNNTSPGRTTTREEFRVNGATGFGLQSDSAQNNYGYARRDARVEFVYTVWSA